MMKSIFWTGTLSCIAFASGASLPRSDCVSLTIPREAPNGASIKHQPSFISFSFEPAYWVDFFGNHSNPNVFTFKVLQEIRAHGGRFNIRPGGDTMDSMCFNESQHADVVLDTSPTGGIYRTTIGPNFYRSWSNFPKGTRFTSTLNFGNDSLDIAKTMAIASATYNPEIINFFELGNEPNNYADADTRWNNTAAGYVKQWLNWTDQIDAAVNEVATFPKEHWWASSATTDSTPEQIKPVDIIPAGVNAEHDISQFSEHSYPFSTCDASRAMLATAPHVLNHTELVNYADTQILPSALASQAAGSEWIIGEFNSISCSGKANTSNSFVQSLWTIDSQLIYAARNASATYLHQGATLVLQSSDQQNTAGANGSPGFSTYDMLYPRTSKLRGSQRTLPGFLGVLFTVEALAEPGTRVWTISAPKNVPYPDYFSAYALYNGTNHLDKVVVLNMYPRYANSTPGDGDFDFSLTNIEGVDTRGATVKRMTTKDTVLQLDSRAVSWAGQTYEQGSPVGTLEIEHVGSDERVALRASEAVLVHFGR